ncbi:MAG: hypothetical protein PHH68_07935 [Candidatus Omnitrophica bacterium]|nr:hypothetical protein [Candidatus Omnitrophota bacterium]
MFKKTAWICLYILIALVGMELVLRLAGWKERIKLYEEIEDQDVRWVHRAGFEGKLGNAQVMINSQGLRDREYPFDKPAGTFRIFAVGECSTVGDYVALEDSLVKRLEFMLNKHKPFGKYGHYEVINGGLTEYDELQKLYFLKKYGLRYNPDLIIFSHDLSVKPWIEPRANLRPVRLMLKKIPKQVYSIRYLLFNTMDIIERSWNQFVFMQGPLYNDLNKFCAKRYAGEGLRNSKIIPALKELAALSRERRIPVLVVFMPWLDNLSEDKYSIQWVHELYAEECRKNGLPLLDLYEACFKNKQPYLFWVDNSNRRPNTLAHWMAAKQVYRELTGKVFLPVILKDHPLQDTVN